jgi:hypothetical protein
MGPGAAGDASEPVARADDATALRFASPSFPTGSADGAAPVDVAGEDGTSEEGGLAPRGSRPQPTAMVMQTTWGKAMNARMRSQHSLAEEPLHRAR